VSSERTCTFCYTFAVLVDRSLVLALYDQGVAAIIDARNDAWDERVCGEWSATDLAGHLLCVIGWYHAQAMQELLPATDPQRIASRRKTWPQLLRRSGANPRARSSAGGVPDAARARSCHPIRRG